MSNAYARTLLTYNNFLFEVNYKKSLSNINCDRTVSMNWSTHTFAPIPKQTLRNAAMNSLINLFRAYFPGLT